MNQFLFLIDVGGGIGHDVDEFGKKHPGLSGRLIVQDLPGTIQQASKIVGLTSLAC